MKTKIAFAVLMGAITTGIISVTLVSVNIGFSASFFRIWLISWGMAYAIVIPAILIIGPWVQKVANKVFPTN